MTSSQKSGHTDRLAIYLPSLSGGGAERVMLNLAEGFIHCGFDVDLVLADATGPYISNTARILRVIDLGSKKVSTSLPGLVRYILRERPTAMLSALSHANVLAVAARYLSRSTTRMVISEHIHLSVSFANAGRVKETWIPRFMRWAYPKADGLVAVSKGVADDLANVIGFPRERIQVIYNPVVSSELLAHAADEPNHPWFMPGTPPVVLGVGRFTPQKDFVLLIRAFAQLRAHREVRLMILGDGELRPRLEALVHQLHLETEVALPGWVDNPFAFMRRAALYVLSSGWEGLPTTLIESMACGTPVVSTDCPSGPAEILENGRWGRLVPVGDAAKLADAMVATLDDTNRPNVALRAQDFGIEQALQKYSVALGVSRTNQKWSK